MNKPIVARRHDSLPLLAETTECGDDVRIVRLCTPIETRSEANKRGSWRKTDRRRRDQQQSLSLVLPLAGRLMQGERVDSILLLRCGRRLDDDNLRGAMKHVRDAVASWLKPGLRPGRADDYFAWEYAQQPGTHGHGTIIEFHMVRT